MNEKHSSKQGSSITYALEKKYFVAATFEGFEQSKKKT